MSQSEDLGQVLADWVRLTAEHTRDLRAQAACVARLARWVDERRVTHEPVALQVAEDAGLLVKALYRLVRLSERPNVTPHDLDARAVAVRDASDELMRVMESSMPLRPSHIRVLREHWALLVGCLMNLAMHTGRCSLDDGLGRAKTVASLMLDVYSVAR